MLVHRFVWSWWRDWQLLTQTLLFTCCAEIPVGGLQFNYSLLSQNQLNSLFTVGVRVVRGKDWNAGNQDGGIGGVGTVTRALRFGFLYVAWDVNKNRSYFYTVSSFSKIFQVALYNSKLEVNIDIWVPTPGQACVLASVLHAMSCEWQSSNEGQKALSNEAQPMLQIACLSVLSHFWVRGTNAHYVSVLSLSLLKDHRPNQWIRPSGKSKLYSWFAGRDWLL